MANYVLEDGGTNAGDKVSRVFRATDGRYLGTVRHCRTGDFKAVGLPSGLFSKGRYYGTLSGAARWLLKQTTK